MAAKHADASRPAQARAGSSSLTVWVGIALLCAGIVAAVGWSAWQAREQALATAVHRVSNLSTILKGHTARTLGEIDLLLRLTAEERADRQLRTTSSLVSAALRDPQRVLGIRVLDPRTGDLVQVGGAVPASGPAIDAEALAAHADPARGGLWIGDPVRDPDRDGWVFGMSRRFRDEARALDVIVMAVVDGALFRDAYQQIDVGRSGAVTVFNARMVVLGRQPNGDGQIGRRFAQLGVFRTPNLERREGVYVNDGSAVDGVRRIVAFQRLGEFPLTITAALAVEDVLAAWRRDTLRAAALTPVAILVLVAFGALLDREIRRRSTAETQARQESAVLEATLENMDQGIMMIDENLHVQVFNRRAAELLDLPDEFLATKPHFFEVTRRQFETGDFANADEAFRRWVRSGGLSIVHHSYERERPNGMVLEIRTVPLPGGGAVRTYTDITARKQDQRRIERMANHDELTGLANRARLRERLAEALGACAAAETPVAVLCLDLDQFKTVNDTLGHSTGDALLKAVAERISAETGGRDLVARLGGDEFAILLVGAEARAQAGTLAGRLVDVLSRPFTVDGQVLTVGTSIGIAVAPGDGLEPDGLMKNADLALYKAKGDGRGTFRFFEAAMDREVQTRRVLERDMREALAAGDFALHYQPQLDLASNRIVGFEALVRWHHRERGPVSPADFIPVAEETGLIVPLGEWVLREACREAAAWPKDVRISVNISAVQFRHRNLVQVVMSALAGAGMPPSRLELEITESVLMQESEASVSILHQLRALGVRIAMDDFGTGYSSLSYLRRFPFDKIKIDRSFVRDLTPDSESVAIVRAIVGLGRSLGIATTAEGVETAEQLAIIRSEGCTEMQGYLLSPPRPAREALALITPAAVA